MYLKFYPQNEQSSLFYFYNLMLISHRISEQPSYIFLAAPTTVAPTTPEPTSPAPWVKYYFLGIALDETHAEAALWTLFGIVIALFLLLMFKCVTMFESVKSDTSAAIVVENEHINNIYY